MIHIFPIQTGDNFYSSPQVWDGEVECFSQLELKSDQLGYSFFKVCDAHISCGFVIYSNYSLFIIQSLFINIFNQEDYSAEYC